MKNQKELINRKDWDCLIILDACRYDYFKNVYSDYLKGSLKKAYSPASYTPQWLKNIFDGDYDDVVYVSGNPYVNSKGAGNFRFNHEKFYDVIDEWEDESSPRDVSKSTRVARSKYPRKKIISHFMQPHAPYFKTDGSVFGKGITVDEPSGKSIRGMIGNVLTKIFGYFIIERLRRKLFDVKSRVEKIGREYGDDFLRELYLENLRCALEEVRTISKRVPGEVVVTSDHGELLGEGEKYCHYPRSENKYLRVVPWFRVEGIVMGDKP